MRRGLRIHVGGNKGGQGRTSEEPERIMCPNKHLERRTREREREREVRARVGENRGTSTETDRGQGAYCAPEAPRENSHIWEWSRETSTKTDGTWVLSRKPPERRTLSNGERSGEREARRFLWPKASREKNRNGDREIRRQVGNRQGDKYGNKWDQKGGRSHYTKRSLPHIYIYIYIYIICNIEYYLIILYIYIQWVPTKLRYLKWPLSYFLLLINHYESVLSIINH